MKNMFIVLAILSFCVPAHADRVTFSAAEPLSVATARTLEWEIQTINYDDKLLVIRYRWIDDAEKAIIMTGGKAWQRIVFQDVADNPETLDVNEAVTEFSDIFSFKIRQQDVGTAIGKGLRDLLWSKVKKKIGINAANTATLKDYEEKTK